MSVFRRIRWPPEGSTPAYSLQGGLAGLVLGSALAFGLLVVVVFSHIFKSPDGSVLFSAPHRPDAGAVGVRRGLWCGAGGSGDSGQERSADGSGAGDSGLRGSAGSGASQSSSVWSYKKNSRSAAKGLIRFLWLNYRIRQ